MKTHLPCPAPLLYLLGCALVLVGWTGTAVAELTASNLRCEYLENPAAIDSRQPRLSWILESSERSQGQSAYQILASSHPDFLSNGQADLWDSSRVTSNDSAQIVYRGAPLESRSKVFWAVRVWDKDGHASDWSRAATWRMGLLQPNDWKGQWIEDRADLPPIAVPATTNEVERSEAQPATMLRKTFILSARPLRATCYASALGLYELRLNGRRVGDHLLAPEWTDYQRRVQYQAYDVTSMLHAGSNAVGALLGDGWYAGRLGMSDGLFHKLRGVYGRKPCLLLQLEIELEDGARAMIVSDDSWSSTKAGPIRSSDLLDGEIYDATREMPGWDTVEFQPTHAWQTARTVTHSGIELVAQPNDPIRLIQELKPLAVSEPKPGVFVFDLGQNMVGWCRLRPIGLAGTQLTLRYAEMLNEDGTVYVANLRSAPQIDRYTMSGQKNEIFEPHFTYHGFRYVEVTGLPHKPQSDALVGCVFNSASREVGAFECAEPMLNQLWRNILWTQRANLMSVPTDCPQRDERLGWMGDIQAFSQTAIFNMDLASFFTKWLHDVRDAQADDGRFADFSPHPYGKNERFSGAPAWADAGVVVPWRAYLNYGDRRILEQQFDSAKRWIEYVRTRNPDLIWRKSRGNDYNDWLNGDTIKKEDWPNRGGAVPNELFATAFFAHSTALVSKMAAVLGREEDGARYRRMFEGIRAAFDRAFLREDGSLLGETQAGYALALSFNLLPEGRRAEAARRMLEGIQKYQNHISTGIQSTHRMLLELTRYGSHQMAWDLASSRTFPSWGYMIQNGATTIWERWDGYVKGRGFQDPGMNSFNHWAFGAIGEWLIRHLAGINPDEQQPGYRHFVVFPRPVGGLKWAKGSYDSIRGRIASEWKADDDQFTLEVTIPANTTATLHIPAPSAESVRENGQPLASVPDLRFIRLEKDHAIVEAGSGSYRFTVKPTR